MENKAENELIRQLKRGDLRAFEAMLSLWEKPILNYVWRLTNSSPDAQDLVQETFIKVYEHRRQIDLQKNFKAWLYKIATNTTYDWLRKKKRRPELLILDQNPNLPETNQTDPAYNNIENSQDVADALSKIRPIYKTLVLLFYQQELSYEEISDATRLPLGTVKTGLFRAKAELKKVLTK